ncbi:MAG: SH3 domain-containing protein [Clostridia bacterium]|nr:SH3 domain-containing protein [Clostridia bacterium]
MKKLLRSTLCMLLAAAMLLGSTSALAAGETAQVTADGVNLREQANTDAEILAELAINTEVEVLAEEDGWYRVLYNEQVGYLRQDYVFLNTTGTRAAYVLEDGVKMRGAPTQDSYVVAELKGGQGVRVKQLIGEWYFVIAGEDTGYVHRTYLSISKGMTAAGNMLKTGMEGQEVKALQKELNRRGFLSADSVTGLYGAKTRAAVADFQKAAGLSSADGIAGPETLQAVYDSSNNIQKENATYNRVKGSVILLDWFEGGKEWLYKGSRFTVTDVRTGLSFRATRFGGWYHADSEPITAADTAIMKRIAGGKWSWDRRAIWITFNGKTVAASMHCMPHMANPTRSNNFDGHFCIHLEGSLVHENSKECPRHQAMVREAYRKGRAS